MQICNFFKKIFNRGGLHIFSAGIINKFLSFISISVIVRVLSKSDYGVFGYSYNLLDFFILFQGLGLQHGVLQFCSESNDLQKQQAIAAFTLKTGTVFNVILMFLGLFFSYIYTFKVNTAVYVFRSIVGLLLLSYMTVWAESYLRAKSMNKEYALLTNISSILILLFSVTGAYFLGLFGYISGRYIGNIGTLLFLLYLLKKEVYVIFTTKVHSIEDIEKKEVLKYSVACMVTNAISHSLYLADIFVIGIVSPDPVILADYKVATQIPFALYFVTMSIVIFIYPYFAKNRLNFSWLKTNSIRLLMSNFILNFCIGLFLFLFAKPIIAIVYGEKYVTILPIFRILIISYITAASLRIPIGNILTMLRCVKYNLISSIFLGLINIVLNYYFIKSMGAIGAAWSTLLTVSLSGGMDLMMYVFILARLKNKRNIYDADRS